MGYVPPKGKTSSTLSETVYAHEMYQSWEAGKSRVVQYDYDFYPTFTRAAGVKNPNPIKGPAKPVGWKPCRNYSRSSGRATASGLLVGWKESTPTIPRLYKIWNHKRNDPNSIPYCPGAATPSNSYGEYPWMNSNTEARLITECLNKVQDRKVNYGESLAESRKTLNHLSRTVIRLFKFVKGMRTLNAKLISEALGLKKGVGKGVSSNWLEYQYGWLPLVNDIYDTVNLTKDGFEQRQLIRAVRALSSTEEVSRMYSSIIGDKIAITGTDTYVDRCILFYEVDSSALLRAGQVGLINPLEVAWAILPYSFLIDWVLPVGNFLQALTATQGLKYIDGCLSRRAKGLRTLTPIDINMDNYPFRKEASTYVATREMDSFVRKRIATAPAPRLYYKSPFSTNHVLSALALFTQLRR